MADLNARERYLVPHRWLAREPRMGVESSVQSAVSRHRQITAQKGKDPDLGKLERLNFIFPWTDSLGRPSILKLRQLPLDAITVAEPI